MRCLPFPSIYPERVGMASFSPLPRAGTTPNWFASVMGTGIVANAVPVLPLHLPGLRGAATVVWAIAAVWLVVLCAVMAGEWRRNASGQLAQLRDPVLAHFWGAPPMALLTVGAGTLALGRDWIGLPAALGVAWVLWVAGTALGLVTAVGLPYRMITGRVVDGEAFGGWLMPVVPPMVSAATGAALVPHLPAGQARLTMVLGCYALFGVSLFATLALLPLIWHRLVRGGPGLAPGGSGLARGGPGLAPGGRGLAPGGSGLAPDGPDLARGGPGVAPGGPGLASDGPGLVRGGPGLAPTVWIVLGPLGQSITAANLLGGVAPFGAAGRWLGVLYGVPTWGFAMLWLVLAIAVVVRAGAPFSLTWWSFTFPLGTCVTGTCALAEVTGAELFTVAGVALYVLLVGLWAAVTARTVVAVGRVELRRFAGTPEVQVLGRR
ncbi:Voltage-dependent anion channel [Amycolatopsis sacchari]|uniref:Voltage-dependent anion channel n=2 Tax=Amycolatopsis sacchari TaxID=115433 RepID=A0A1I3NKH7_9PSEU|nr:Voltage-dependent anion channel [Amycolatopsis sacchari]